MGTPSGEPPASSVPLGRRVVVNTGALAAANLGRIVVSFLIQLVVARRLGLDVLGQYTVAMAYLNISQVLCEAGLPLWIVREIAHRPTYRRAYFRRSLALQWIAAALVWLALTGLTAILPYPLATRQAIFLVGLSLPFFAVASAAGTIFQAGERLDLLLIVEIATNGLILLASLFVVARAGTVAHLLAVVVAAQALSVLVALGLLQRSRLMAGPQARVTLSLWQMARQAIALFGLSLADTLLQRLDILLLSLLGDPRLTGLYSAAYNLVRVGVKLVQSVWRALYPTLARLTQHAPAQAARLGQDTLRFGLLATLAVAAVTSGIAGDLLALIYGADTSPDAAAGAQTLAWLIWVLPLLVIQFYLSTQFIIAGQTRAALGVTLATIAGVVVLLPLLARWAGAPGAAWATLLAQIGGTALGLALARNQTRYKIRFASQLMRLLPLVAVTMATSLWLPLVWWLRGAVALLIFVLALQPFGLLTRQDWQTLRKALRQSTD